MNTKRIDSNNTHPSRVASPHPTYPLLDSIRTKSQRGGTRKYSNFTRTSSTAEDNAADDTDTFDVNAIAEQLRKQDPWKLS